MSKRHACQELNDIEGMAGAKMEGNAHGQVQRCLYYDPANGLGLVQGMFPAKPLSISVLFYIHCICICIFILKSSTILSIRSDIHV